MGKKHHNNWVIIVILLVAVAIAITIFLLKGTVTTTGSYPEAETSISLKCESQTTAYPIFTYDNSTKKDLLITAIYNGKKLNSISLNYILQYDNEKNIVRSEAANHAAVNTSYSNDKLASDSYNTKYTILSDRLQTTLYASGDELNVTSAKYFMIDSDPASISIENLQLNYEQQGFNCQLIN